MSQKLSKEVQNIVDRLKDKGDCDVAVDKEVIEHSFKKHFKLLGLELLPFKYIETAELGYKYVYSAAESASRQQSRQHGRQQSRQQSRQRGRRHG